MIVYGIWTFQEKTLSCCYQMQQSYMTACTVALKVLYPYLFHVTCTAHMLHNCAEKVRSYFTEVDNLVDDDVVLRHTPRFHGARTVLNC